MPAIPGHFLYFSVAQNYPATVDPGDLHIHVKNILDHFLGDALFAAGVFDDAVLHKEKLIAERAAAKKAKNYAEADRIRQYLADKGVTLIDDRSGTSFKIG